MTKLGPTWTTIDWGKEKPLSVSKLDSLVGVSRKPQKTSDLIKKRGGGLRGLRSTVRVIITAVWDVRTGFTANYRELLFGKDLRSKPRKP
jgi:hypothetical protein